ncbi:MAG TPA: hypothetical protein PLS49_04300 [Candidatus Woesebacteria bacterium]|nr:hypothetical protein [Candidatus Woesebacteria bacterium]
MSHPVIPFLKKNIYIILLLFITGIICFTTYIPGTWLTGWDTVHPEFNFQLNFERIINGVWREEQGLGTVAAHAHMSELPRYIILWIFSWFLPDSFLRYSYIFICFILGPIGMYQFTRYILQSDPNKDTFIIGSSSFLGGLFYIFNISVFHHFLVPFEMFPTKYALLPWLFFFATKYVKEKRKKDLILFTLTTFFSTPMAYAFQLWYVYFGSLCIYLFGIYIHQRSWDVFKKNIILILITLCINAYWLLPNIYFVLTNAQYIPQAHSNMLFSERMFAFNKARGSFLDVAILQGSLYDWSKFDGLNFVSLFDTVVKNHLEKPFIMALGYLNFIIIIVGIIRLFFSKNKFAIWLIPVSFVSIIFMANTSQPFDFLFSYLRENSSLLKEGLRSPYTKFSIMLLFTYAFFFAYIQPFILNRIRSTWKYVYVCFISLLLIIYMFPLFQGKLIDKSMKIAIPQGYFDMFQWFQQQNRNTRIATFPVHSFWGWEYYNWGYQGAGFIWFGLPQSVLVRDFDRWHPNNENFYWEFAYSIYSENPILMQKVLNKYNVKWLIVDKNIISPNNPKALFFNEFEELTSNLGFLKKTITFGNIDVYTVALDNPSNQWTNNFNNLPIIEPSYTWDNNDKAFAEYGNYISSGNVPLEPTIIYPFRSIFTGRSIEKLQFDITETNKGFIFSQHINSDNYDVNQYSLITSTNNSLVEIDPETLEENTIHTINTTYTDGLLSVNIPKFHDYYSYDSNIDDDLDNYPITRCDQSLDGSIERYSKNGLTYFYSQNASNCLDILIPQLSHRYAYLVTIESHHNKGMPILFSIQNKDTRKSEVETYLPNTSALEKSYFIIPPMKFYGQQYALHFDNLSIGNDPSINELGTITVQPFPYEYIKEIKLTNQNLTSNTIFTYEQNYERGWQAYKVDKDNKLAQIFPFFGGERFTNHVKVNNWANGWIIDQKTSEDKSIIIIFWPQYLQYIGFAMLLLTPLLLIFIPKEKSTN